VPPGIPTSLLIAPDSFKGTFRAVEVAEAIGAGARKAGADVDLCPVADGGEGTLEVLALALGAELHTAAASDPLGRVIEASYGLVAPRRRGQGPLAIVEVAAASGLGLVAERDRDPLAASTRGTGELIADAVRAGATTVLLGVGGSATTDGGSGAIAVLRRLEGFDRVRLVVLCDVRTPFEDAARVFGPQKGADEDAVRALTRRLGAQARRLPRDPRGVPMTGAAGGISGGLWAAFGAELVPGAGFILDAIDFDVRMRAARAVVGGEGRLDSQSLAGKAVSEVSTRARQAGVPAYAVVGRNELDSFGQRILDLQQVIEAGTESELTRAGAELARLVLA
jgi:glycerate kinase